MPSQDQNVIVYLPVADPKRGSCLHSGPDSPAPCQRSIVVQEMNGTAMESRAIKLIGDLHPLVAMRRMPVLMSLRRHTRSERLDTTSADATGMIRPIWIQQDCTTRPLQNNQCASVQSLISVHCMRNNGNLSELTVAISLLHKRLISPLPQTLGHDYGGGLLERAALIVATFASLASALARDRLTEIATRRGENRHERQG